MYFVATDFDGEVQCDNHSEMVAPQMSDLGMILTAVENGQDNLFLPFADSFDMLNEVLSQKVNVSSDSDDFSETVLPYRKKAAIIETSEADDFNESDHPRDENGRFTESGGGGSGGSGESGSPSKVSAEGANASCKGFTTPENLTRHYSKHSSEFGFASEAEYQSAADRFLQQPCGGDVIGYSTPRGKVVRFNTKTTEYASGYPGQNICTYMKAKCGSDGTANPEKAQAYYDKFKEKDGV